MISAKDDQKKIIYNLMQLYTYELSFYEDETTNFNLLETGLYEMNQYLELYWKEDERHTYILKIKKQINYLSVLNWCIKPVKNRC